MRLIYVTATFWVVASDSSSFESIIFAESVEVYTLNAMSWKFSHLALYSNNSVRETLVFWFFLD